MANEFTGKVIADKYRVEERIAASGLGELYRGANVLLEKPVSIAVLPGEISRDEHIAFRFLTDARVLAKLNHPNVLNVTDFGTDPNGIAYAVYEAASGETLREAIEREGRLPLAMAVDIAKQAGSALAAAHAFGVVHRSLNTSNIVAATDDL